MCRYKGIWYYECQHIRFNLSMLCQDLLDQISRIEDSIGRADHCENPQSCLPRVLTKDRAIVMEAQEQDGGATNIDQWVTDLAEQCPSCAMCANGTNMCLYEGTYYTICNHYIFRLLVFCQFVKQELDRINLEADRDNHGIPCDAVFSCRPRVTRISEGNVFTDVTMHAVVGAVASGDMNIVAWMDVPFCDDCWQDARIPEVEWELGMR